MEEMKNFIRFVLPLLLIISFASCASTGGVYKENNQSHKKLLFEDWKYKGFGHPLPKWYEAAYEGNTEKLVKNEEALSGKEFVIIRGEGINSDQAERVMDLQKAELSEDFSFYDSCWAMKSNGNYISIAIYIKNIKE